MGDPTPPPSRTAIGHGSECGLGQIQIHLAGLRRNHAPVGHPPPGDSSVRLLDDARLDARHPEDRLGGGGAGQVGGRGGQAAQPAHGPALFSGRRLHLAVK
jgi:hypothetical protein